MLFLKILAILLLVLLVLIFLGLMGKVGAQIFWQETGVVFKIRLGFLSIQLYPFPWKGHKKSKPKAERQKKSSQPSKKSWNLHPENLDWRETLAFVIRFLEELRGTVTIQKLQLRLIVASPDAAKTALRYGKIWQVVGVLQPLLHSWFSIKQQEIQIRCDFERKKMSPDCELFFYTRPIRIVRVIWKERKALWSLYQALTKKEEEVIHVQSSHS